MDDFKTRIARLRITQREIAEAISYDGNNIHSTDVCKVVNGHGKNTRYHTLITVRIDRLLTEMEKERGITNGKNTEQAC